MSEVGVGTVAAGVAKAKADVILISGGEGGTGGEGGKGEEKKGADDATPKFTQAQVNKMMAEEKRKHQKVVERQVAELETLKKSKSLSDKDRETLTSQIQALNDSLLTKEELARKEQEKIKGEHKRQVDALIAERDSWKNQFTQLTITRTILDEAVAAEAYSPSQIVALLQGQARLVEVTDAEGNVVPGQFAAKIRMSDTDKEGKPVTLDMTVKEALKRMKDRADEFGNLFKSGVAGGLGDSKSLTTGKEVDPSKLGPAAYREYRKKRGW